MPVDPTQMIERIAHYAVREHPDRPWPDKSEDISIVDIITRHTPLLAVVWGEVDNKEEDQDLISGSGTSRVVFSLTAVSQIKKNVTRMALHLSNAVNFNSQLIGSSARDDNDIHIPSHRIEYFVEEVNAQFVARKTPIVLPIPIDIRIADDFDTTPVYLLSCYLEGRTVNYDPSLDVWKGQVIFIADMTNNRPEI